MQTFDHLPQKKSKFTNLKINLTLKQTNTMQRDHGQLLTVEVEKIGLREYEVRNVDILKE